jgi:hypothetical protein
MPAPLPHALLLVEGTTRQRAAIGVDPERTRVVADALALFRRPPDELLAAGRLAGPGVAPFLEMGECLFAVDASGELGALRARLRLLRGHEPVDPGSPLLFERRPLPDGEREVMLAELTIDRRDVEYDRDWRAYHLRKRRQAAAEIEAFLLDAAAARHGRARAERALEARDERGRALLLEAAARRVFEAPFELYSRFVGERRLIKDGLATLRNVSAGHGGACSEKAQAVRLLADALDLPAAYVLAGPNTRGEVPVDALLQILETFEVQYTSTAQAFWNHLAVLVELGGDEVLVDASNGNIPFLWTRGEELAAMLDRRGRARRGVAHRYVVGADELFYHRVDQRVPERLLYALELGWADPHIDLVQALDDELGLLSMPDLWLGVLAFRDEAERRTLREWYLDRWLGPGHVRGVEFATDCLAAPGPMAAELRARYPAAARAATEGRAYIEDRLEEANPGSSYRVEFIVAGRRADG